MKRGGLWGFLLGALPWALTAYADPHPRAKLEITYRQALALARSQAPELATARARVQEAESRARAASVARFNPQLSGSLGPRLSETGTILDGSVGVQQWLDIGGERGHRRAAAEAGRDASEAWREDAERQVLRDTGLAFISTLHAAYAIALAEESLQIAEAIRRVAARRHELGDVGGLEASVAELAVARAGSRVDRARALHDQAKGRLKALLGLEPATEVVCRGSLRELALPNGGPKRTRERADIRAHRAEIREAASEVELGLSGRVPELAIGAGYEREESDDIVQTTLGLRLPIFDRGQGLTKIARARRARLQTELRAIEVDAALEADAAGAVARRLGAAVRRFGRDGVERIQRSERLATQNYEAGAIPLGELLAVRRELLDAKLDYAELLRGAAAAQTELAASRGAL